MRETRKSIWVGIALGVLAALVGEAAAYVGVPSPNRTNVLYAIIGIAALYRGRPTGLAVAVVAWLYELLSVGLPALPFAYSDEGLLRLFVTAFAMPGVALVLGAFHDTLAHVRRSEAAQRETGETLAVIIGAAPAAVITADVEGRVKLWNPAAERCSAGPPRKSSDSRPRSCRRTAPMRTEPPAMGRSPVVRLVTCARRGSPKTGAPSTSASPLPPSATLAERPAAPSIRWWTSPTRHGRRHSASGRSEPSSLGN